VRRRLAVDRGATASAAVRALAVALVAIATLAAAAQPAPTPLFTFHSNAWINLHFVLRAHARGGPAGAKLPPGDREPWEGWVQFYQRYAKRDVLMDDGMVAIKNALAAADGRATLDGAAIEADLRSTLERAMPVYRRHWWDAHDRANRDWIAAIEPLVARHGRAIAARLAAVYDVKWPSTPIDVDVSVVAGPVGAYTTRDPTHVMISSQDPGYRGYAGLEMLFHESSHGVANLYQAVDAAARRRGVTVPSGLWHGVLFYTAGELTRQELASAGIAYKEYAGPEIYDNLCGPGCRDRIAAHWAQQLGTPRPGVETSLNALVASFKP
jgi:hypothetical protein